MNLWRLDPTHTYASFSVRHMMVTTVRGKFENIDGAIQFDPEAPENSSVDVVINAGSIRTGIEDRDNHLRSADFLDIENYPTITFRSTGIEITDENEGKITGDLTIHGVTKSIVIDAEYFGQNTNPYGTSVIGFAGSTKINREDFGLVWNVALETGGVLVGKEIRIDLDVEAILETASEREVVSEPA